MGCQWEVNSIALWHHITWHPLAHFYHSSTETRKMETISHCMPSTFERKTINTTDCILHQNKAIRKILAAWFFHSQAHSGRYIIPLSAITISSAILTLSTLSNCSLSHYDWISKYLLRFFSNAVCIIDMSLVGLGSHLQMPWTVCRVGRLKV